ncbi:MAG: DNA mismatch repair endonuclease MutL [Ruminococcaceae bacterium]|nr:DNA mismatch repair endonuclease MutL [Oscillospiraceae bacterium]
MGQIILLDELTTCKIAAGEVIERPASVVKEMVENSIDAGATSVSVEIKNGGIKYIRISDNGSGIADDDAEIAFDKHATSKIRSADDLESVGTLGFRGEALASIAAVSDVELTTRCEGTDTATFIHIKGGKILERGSKGAGYGTTFVVRDLFYNTPARYKFLKKDSTEAGYICDVLQKLALAHPEVAIRLISSGTELLRTPGNGDLKSTIYSIYGKKIADSIRVVNYNESGIKITGFVGAGEASSGNRSRQIFFVNGRYIKSKTITAALDEGMKTTVMKGRFAFAVLSVEVSPYFVDVNVHPTKIEVRFSDENALFRAVLKAIPYGDYYSDLYESARESNFTISESNMGDRPGVGSVSLSEVQPKPQNFTDMPKAQFGGRKLTNSWTFNNVDTVATIDKESYEEKRSETILKATEATPVIPFSAGLSVVRETDNSPVEIVPEKNIQKKQEIVNRFYIDARVVGQVLNTYIVLEYNSSVFLLDQHAAHERLLYEQLKETYKNGDEFAVQPLLVPITISMSPGEMQKYMNKTAALERLGFEIDLFGKDVVVVRSVPSILGGADISAVISALVEKGDRASNSDLIEDEKLYTMACKAAVKGNNALSDQEINKLLQDLAMTDRPGTCPHGRPIVIEITKREIEKKFKRII